MAEFGRQQGRRMTRRRQWMQMRDERTIERQEQRETVADTDQDPAPSDTREEDDE